jgi:transcriptional regulator with XRE-family HTH domain
MALPGSADEIDELMVLAKIKHHIREKGLTQESVADQMGISAGHLSQMLMGIKSFKLSHLLKLLQVAQIDPRIFVSLMPYEGQQNPFADFKHPIIAARLLEKLRIAGDMDAKLLTLVEAYLDGMIAQRKCRTRKKK